MRAKVVLVGAVLALVGIGSAAGATPRELEGFAAEVERTRVGWEVPGLAMGIVHRGEVVFLEGFGLRDLERNLPVTPQTLFASGRVPRHSAPPR
jgi:CubicO group peptidase (beta-lactamase class C family)